MEEARESKMEEANVVYKYVFKKLCELIVLLVPKLTT